jgi:hypothetical protein
VWIERRGFRETPVLLSEVARMGPVGRISLEDFFAGRWQPSIEAVLDSKTPWVSVPSDGERRIAERLADLLSL